MAMDKVDSRAELDKISRDSRVVLDSKARVNKDSRVVQDSKARVNKDIRVVQDKIRMGNRDKVDSKVEQVLTRVVRVVNRAAVVRAATVRAATTRVAVQ